MIEKNKITLLGDPVTYGKFSKVGSFLLGSDARNAALTLLFYTTARSVCSPAEPIADLLFNSARLLPGVALMVGAARWYTCLNWNKTAVRKKVINTQPDGNTVPTDASGLMFALMMKLDAERQGILFSIVSAASVVSDLVGGNPMKMLPLTFALTTPLFAHAFCNRHRAHKILDGSWVIENKGPPPKRVPAREKVKRMLGVLVPASDAA